MKYTRISSLLMALQFANAQRLTSVTFNTQNKEVNLHQRGVKVDKPYLTFELKCCSNEAGLRVNSIYFAFHPASSEFATNVNGYHKRIPMNLGLSCSSYKKFKVSWIHGNLSLWHIVSSKWQIIESSNSPLQVKFSDITFYRRNYSADWRVYYYDESPATPVRETWIKI